MQTTFAAATSLLAVVILAGHPTPAAAQAERSTTCAQGPIYLNCSIPVSMFPTLGMYSVRLAFGAAPAGLQVSVRVAVAGCNVGPSEYGNQRLTPGPNVMVGGLRFNPGSNYTCVMAWIACFDGRTERSCAARGMPSLPTMRVTLLTAG